jgi:Phage protein (N4 Gp49/phage Sf6 gene 66) family
MNHITSPRTDDDAVEQMIKAKGLVAPRVTPQDLNDNITDVEIVKHVSRGGQVLRWAVLTTKSGYAVVGNPSVAVSPENDDEEVGKKVAFENSKNALWPLMGYALKEKLA